jgi:hypothetical protein
MVNLHHSWHCKVLRADNHCQDPDDRIVTRWDLLQDVSLAHFSIEFTPTVYCIALKCSAEIQARGINCLDDKQRDEEYQDCHKTSVHVVMSSPCCGGRVNEIGGTLRSLLMDRI